MNIFFLFLNWKYILEVALQIKKNPKLLSKIFNLKINFLNLFAAQACFSFLMAKK